VGESGGERRTPLYLLASLERRGGDGGEAFWAIVEAVSLLPTEIELGVEVDMIAGGSGSYNSEANLVVVSLGDSVGIGGGG
jgi:hypothetical protein